ncbi:unnamed protein product, partial [Staurois parvus]
DTREQRAEDAGSDEPSSVLVRQISLKVAGGRVVESQTRSAMEDQSDRRGDRRIFPGKPEVNAGSGQAEVRNKLVRYQQTITGNQGTRAGIRPYGNGTTTVASLNSRFGASISDRCTPVPAHLCMHIFVHAHMHAQIWTLCMHIFVHNGTSPALWASFS